MASILKKLNKMYILYCYSCSSRYEMYKDGETFTCPECYKSIDICNINDDDFEFDYNSLRNYIINNPSYGNKIIAVYLRYIGMKDEIIYNKKLISILYEDLYKTYKPLLYSPEAILDTYNRIV